jgi:hypothetical protein
MKEAEITAGQSEIGLAAYFTVYGLLFPSAVFNMLYLLFIF